MENDEHIMNNAPMNAFVSQRRNKIRPGKAAVSKALVDAVKKDLMPSLGVTEPGAIAYAAACAARALGGRVKLVRARLNSCIYKNSFTCSVPGTDGMGCALAAALGAVCGAPEKKLMATEGASAEAIAEAKRLVAEGKATAELAAISPEVFIEAEAVTENGTACAVVAGRHDRLVELTVNGIEMNIEAGYDENCTDEFKVSFRSFDELLDCVEEADGLEFLDEAVKMNLALYEEGKDKGLTPLTEARCGEAHSSVRAYAELFTCGAIEARVRGAAAPAMAITGSGSHGILCTLPVYEASKFYGLPQNFEGGELELQRALLLSCLITKYIKELSGLLSTACGCVLAGGTGAALGITYLYSKTLSPAADRSELKKRLTDALNSMAASVTGMICHGGNTGCSLKAAVGVNMAFNAAEMAVAGVGAESIHGILGATAEETMRNMGAVACGMLPLESEIIGIMNCKAAQKLI